MSYGNLQHNQHISGTGQQLQAIGMSCLANCEAAAAMVAAVAFAAAAVFLASHHLPLQLLRLKA